MTRLYLDLAMMRAAWQAEVDRRQGIDTNNWTNVQFETAIELYFDYLSTSDPKTWPSDLYLLDLRRAWNQLKERNQGRSLLANRRMYRLLMPH